MCADKGVGDLSNGQWMRRTLLRTALRGADPAALTQTELLLMIDVLQSALATVGDSPADLGEELVGREFAN